MKTSNYLKASLGFLVTAIIVLGIAEVLSKRKLKACESRQSVACPRFTCPESDGTDGSPGQCGQRPWICPNDNAACSPKVCIGYCKKDEQNCFD